MVMRIIFSRTYSTYAGRWRKASANVIFHLRRKCVQYRRLGYRYVLFFAPKNEIEKDRGKYIEFDLAKSRLGYTICQKLEGGLQQILQGTAHNKWNTIKGTIQPITNSFISIAALIEAFKRLYIPEPAAIENQP